MQSFRRREIHSGVRACRPPRTNKSIGYHHGKGGGAGAGGNGNGALGCGGNSGGGDGAYVEDFKDFEASNGYFGGGYYATYWKCSCRNLYNGCCSCGQWEDVSNLSNLLAVPILSSISPHPKINRAAAHPAIREKIARGDTALATSTVVGARTASSS